MFCACTTGNCAMSTLVGAFLTGSDKVTWSDEALSGSGPVQKYVLRMPHFPLRLFLSSSTVVTWLPDVTKGHLTPSGFPWASSGHVTLSLPVKKAPLERILCNLRLRMRRTYFRIWHVTNATSGHVTSGHAQWSDPPHDTPQMRLELFPYTTNHHRWNKICYEKFEK